MSNAEKLHVISTNEEIDALIEYLSNPEHVICAYDCETDGLPLSARVVGLSVSVDPVEAFYVVTRVYLFDKTVTQVPCEECIASGEVLKPRPKGVKAAKGVKPEKMTCPVCSGRLIQDKAEFSNCRLETLPNEAKVKELLEVLKTKALVTHNGTVDFNWTLRNYGIDLRPASYADTMPAAHLIDENRPVALKKLGLAEFGEDAMKEQQVMKASVLTNGGRWEDKRGGERDMFKADPAILGYYGAKDALLTLKLWYLFSEQMEQQGLMDFFFEESMPLFKGPIYDLNTTGLKIDTDRLRGLQADLQRECALLQAQIEVEITPYVTERYPKGFGKKPNYFNVSSGVQLSWLLFVRLKQDWKKLTDGGRQLAKSLVGKTPYNPSGRRKFEEAVAQAVDLKGQPVKLEKYIKCDKGVLTALSFKYKWVDLLLQHKKAKKLLNTYCDGILSKVEYGIVHPGFLQCSTTGNRLSSRGPNFQQLPREDRRLKACVVSRPGKVFVAADFEQIEPRVFASFAGDTRLLECFARGEDFYSVVGIDAFGKHECTPYKSGPNSFGEMYPVLRQVAKEVALAAVYGITAFKLTEVLNTKAPRPGNPWDFNEVQEIIDRYFAAYPQVKAMQEKYHKLVVEEGVVHNLFGRPRHLPLAKSIKRYGNKINPKELPYELRTLLNNSVNFPIQATAGSILSRCCVELNNRCRGNEAADPRWAEVFLVASIHDEAVVECPEQLAEEVAALMQDCMQNTVTLPGVALIAKPKIGRSLAEVK